MEAFKRGGRELGAIVNQALRYKVEFLKSNMKIDDKKLRIYERFIEKARHMGVMEVVWRMCYVVGEALLRQNEKQKAIKYFALAIDTIELTRAKLREDTIKKLFASSVQDVYEQIINILFELGRYEKSFDYVERSRARAFLDMLAGRSIKAKKDVDPQLLKEEKRIQQELEQLKRALTSSKAEKRKSLYREYLMLLKKRKDILERIKDQSLQYVSTVAVTTVPREKILSALGTDTAILSYLVEKRRVLIFLLKGQEGIVGIKKDIPIEELKELVSDYRDAIASQQDLFAIQVGERITDILINPVMNRIRDVRKLIIIPSRFLHYLPFNSLPVSKDEYLIEKYTISLLPSASSLFFMSKGVTTGMDSIFAIGNPWRPEKEMALEFAQKEVKGISAYFKKSTILIGKQAKESYVKTAKLTGISVIHIAAHGRYNTTHPLKSAILLTGGDGEDGNLETFEIFSLNMNPMVVVLSACQSGLGTVIRGEEVEGLNRAFLYAGAGGVVASLWRVSDESTCSLMNYFYKALQSRPSAEALREAQLKLMKEYPSPYFWSAFYLTGGL
jgi:CHAT domain-containing protein